MKIKVGEFYNIMFIRDPFEVKVTDIYKADDILYVKYLDSFNKTETFETAESFKRNVQRAYDCRDAEHFEEIEI
jgi:hypothetical protein